MSRARARRLPRDQPERRPARIRRAGCTRATASRSSREPDGDAPSSVTMVLDLDLTESARLASPRVWRPAGERGRPAERMQPCPTSPGPSTRERDGAADARGAAHERRGASRRRHAKRDRTRRRILIVARPVRRARVHRAHLLGDRWSAASPERLDDATARGRRPRASTRSTQLKALPQIGDPRRGAGTGGRASRAERRGPHARWSTELAARAPAAEDAGGRAARAGSTTGSA